MESEKEMKSTFLRKATGLVRPIGLSDAYVFNLMTINHCKAKMDMQ
jgi:hypothetical protein